MPTRPADESVTAAAIRKLLIGYVAAPLRHLREINSQVHLGNLILDELHSRGEPIEVTATVSTDGSGLIRIVRSDTPTLRVQHEMRVQGAKLEGASKLTREKSDIVLLKAAPAEVHLRRERNGVLDVIAPISVTSIDAVIEIKAACSFDPEQRHLFRMDVAKLQALLDASEGTAPEFHFVLLDKSLPVGPHIQEFGPLPVDSWECGAPGGRQLKRKGAIAFEPSPQLALSAVISSEPVIHVWDLDPDLVVRHRVCSAAPLPDLELAAKLGLVKKAKSKE